MSLSRMYTPVLHFDDINGRPLVGGKLYTYEANSSTPAPTYRDKSGTLLNENPISLDERGECEVWLVDGLRYKMVLVDPIGTQVLEADDVSSSGSGSSSLHYSYGVLTYLVSNHIIFNNKIIQLNNDTHLTSATLHINSDTSINEANHTCIEFDNNYSHSCDIEIIDDATNTKLRYDTDKGYTIPANTFVQITVLGHCWTFKEYTQPS